MLNAKQAKEQTEMNKISNCKAEIKKAINKAIQKGREYIYLTTIVSTEVKKELNECGYKVENQIGRTKISW